MKDRQRDGEQDTNQSIKPVKVRLNAGPGLTSA